MTEFRPTLPKLKSGCSANAAVLNHSAVVGLARDWLTPVAFGRSTPMLVLARFTPSVGFIGNPDRQVTMEPSCQSPSRAFTNLLRMLASYPYPQVDRTAPISPGDSGCRMPTDRARNAGSC